MLNYNSPIIQNMIQQGQLSPQTLNPYNGNLPNYQQSVPYQPQQVYYQPQQMAYYQQPQQQYYNNMIPFGGYQQQPQQVYNQPQQQNTQFVFQPTGYNYQQQQSPYAGYNQYPQYNNYGYGYYNNGYYNNGYSYYNQSYDPFLFAKMNEDGEVVFHKGYIQPSEIRDVQRRKVEMNKLKTRLCAKYFGQKVDEEFLDRRFNPDNKANKVAMQEYYNDPNLAELKRMNQIGSLVEHPVMETQAMQTARLIRDMSANFHREFDNVGLCEFLEDHLWKFQREWWIRDNIDFNNSKDLSDTYNKNYYKELLGMHRGGNGQFMNDLLNTSKYDSNLDDPEIGLPSVLLTAEQRRKQILEGPVPHFISSPETQRKRNEFFSQLTGLIAAKQQGQVN